MLLTSAPRAKKLFLPVNLQNWPSKPFIIVNTPDDQNWRSIFSLLLKEQEPEIGGRASIPDELRSDLERLARGGVNEADIQNICGRIVLSPEALTTLARLLQDSSGSASTQENS